MKGAGKERLLVVRALGLFALGVVVAVACGGPQKQAAGGAVCFRADDCEPGFACVPEARGSSKRVCSNDLTVIVSTVDGAPPAMDMDGGADASSGGAAAMGGEASTAGGAPSAGAAAGGAGAAAGGAGG